MVQCQCIKRDGKQCIRSAGAGINRNPLYCWQHQQASGLQQGSGLEEEDENHPSRNLSILSGPTKFSFYPDVNGIRILLLGERHDTKGLCSEYDLSLKGGRIYEVHKWLGDLAKNAPECLDILVEQPFLLNDQEYEKEIDRGTDLISYSSPLAAIIKEFEKCQIILKKDPCYSPHLRYHYIDLRRIVTGKSAVVQMGNLVYEGYSTMVKYKFNFPVSWVDVLLETDFKYVDDERTILSYVIGVDLSQSSQEIYEQYMISLSENLKEQASQIYYGIDLDPFTYDHKRDFLYMKNLHNKINKEVEKMDTSIDRKEFLETLLNVYLDHQGLSLGEKIFLIPMDLYLLTRLFINFDQAKMNRGPPGCHQNKIIKNAIIYAGWDHTDIYDAFIAEFFGVYPEIEVDLQMGKKSQSQCIKFLQPFDFFA